MSEHRCRVINSAKKYTKEMAIGKENIYLSKQTLQTVSTNKVTVAFNSQKNLPRRRHLSDDLDCRCSYNPPVVKHNVDLECRCSYNGAVVKHNVAFNEGTSSTRKTPFRVHHDRAGNDLNKGLRFRERIIEYETRRVEEIKRKTRVIDNKVETTDEQKVISTKKQQLESNWLEDRLRNFKGNVAIVRNSAVPDNKPKIRSIETVSGYNFPKQQVPSTKSWVDLSQVNKPRIVTTKANDVVKKHSVKSTPYQQNLNHKRSASTQSINKLNTLGEGWNRVHVRSRSCSNQRSTDQAKNKVTSTESTKEVHVEKQLIETAKSKKFGGSKDSLISGSQNVVLPRVSSQKKGGSQTVKDGDQGRANTKGSIDSNDKVRKAKEGEKSNDDAAKQASVQRKVESGLQTIKQNADVSAYLLYNAEYLQDLLKIEKEKENVEPKLSSEFIDKYIDNEPRKIIVAYLIRLCSHCRYPSFILYQTVKLFDAVLDKISIEKSDMQLAALTTLWIVLKKDGNFDKIPSAKSTLALAQDLQTDANVLAEWERLILVSLNFNITFSDPFSIFVFYVINYDYKPGVSNGIITKIYYCGGYAIDLTLLDVQFSYTTSNHLALATAELVMSLILDDEAHLTVPRWRYWREIITNGVDMPISYYDDEINFLRVAMIGQILESAKKHTKEEVVRKKYSHSRYGNISEFFIDRIKKIPQAEYSISM